METVCKQCGKTFDVKPSRLNHGRGQTCSPACQYASMRRQVSVVCKQCGKTFDVQQSDYDYRSSQGMPPSYCSRDCSHSSPTRNAKLGASLRTSEVARAARASAIQAMNSSRTPEQRSAAISLAWKNPETRSRLMAGIARRSEDPAWRNAGHFQPGPAHPRYTGRVQSREGVSRYAYKKWRSDVLSRDGRTCTECGTSTGRIFAHHILPWSEYPDARYDTTNGTTLCKVCHDRAHGRTSHVT